jgi:hypothetical protein
LIEKRAPLTTAPFSFRYAPRSAPHRDHNQLGGEPQQRIRGRVPPA